MIKIKKLNDFLNPLKSLKNDINSVIFSKDSTGNLNVNVKSLDANQIVNLSWKGDIIDVDSKFDKIGIYNLSEFISTLEMFGDGEIEMLSMEDNKAILKYSSNKDAEVKYTLSDLSLIEEGPASPKNPITFLLSLEFDNKFLSKVKKIASSLGVNTLKFESKAGKLSYSISDKYFHSHIVKENIPINTSNVADFSISVNIEKLNIIPEDKNLIISLHEKVLEFKTEKQEYMYRYYIAPLVKE